MKTPALDAIDELQDQSQPLAEFLMWLHQHDMMICAEVDVSNKWDDIIRWCPIPYTHETLLARYFGIDAKQAKKERRALLAEIRGED